MSSAPFIYTSSNQSPMEIALEPCISNLIAFRAINEENYFFDFFDKDVELESELFRFMTYLDRDMLKSVYPSYRKVILSFPGDISPFYFTNEVIGALNAVLISLKAYYEAPNPVISFNSLKYWVITIEGASYLKKIRKLSIVKNLLGTFYEIPTWINDVPSYEVLEVGDIFNYQYCFPWKATDDKDYLIAFEPVNADVEHLQLFRLKLRHYLSQVKGLIYVDPLEILLNVSSSIAQSNGKSVPHYLAKNANLQFSKKRTKGKRIFITTSPGDGRDAIINEINDLNTIQLIDQQLEILLQDAFFSEFLVEKDTKKFDQKYEKFLGTYHYFLMRDIKKEGLSKPKVLLKIMLEELHTRWPDCKAFEATEFYDGPWFEGDNTQRGHGLGMANNLTTLMQIINFGLLIDKITELDHDIEIGMICHNDDIIIGLNGDESSFEDALNSDCEILEKLGILLSHDKSFWSPTGGILCERYRNRFIEHPKVSYINREKLLLFTCINVTQMKSMLSAFYHKFEREIDLRELISYFGYEFCPEEFSYPISMGGWTRDKAFRCSFEIKYLEENICDKLIRVYLASMHNKATIKKRKVKPFTPPVLQLFPSQIWNSVPDYILEGFDIIGNFRAKMKFTRLRKLPQQRQTSWVSLMKYRQKVFNRPAPNLSVGDFYKLAIEKFQNIFPPDFAIDRWVDIECYKRPMKDPYDVPNPICCALSKLKLVDTEKYNQSFWPLRVRTTDSLKKASVRKDLTRVIHFVPPVYNFIEEDTIIPRFDKDFNDFWLSYPAPLLMGKVCEIYGKIPIVKDEYKIFEKSDVWDFQLDKTDFLLFQSVPFDEFKFLLQQKKEFKLTNSDIFEIIDILKKPKVSDLKHIKQLYEFESDDEFSLLDIMSLTENLPKPKITPPCLSWEESWAKIAETTERKSFSFDSFYFDLDPTMKEIVGRIKEIFQLRELLTIITDDERAKTLRERIIAFADEYPDFLELFELEDPRIIKEDSDSGEGQFGDFDINDFT